MENVLAIELYYRVSQQVLDGKLLVKISKTAKSEFGQFFVKKIVKLKEDLHCLANFHDFFSPFATLREIFLDSCPKLVRTPGILSNFQVLL